MTSPESPAVQDTDRLREVAAEAEGLRRNGPASDGRGWYRTEADRMECFAIAGHRDRPRLAPVREIRNVGPGVAQPSRVDRPPSRRICPADPARIAASRRTGHSGRDGQGGA
jgi:hypothetical protein